MRIPGFVQTEEEMLKVQTEPQLSSDCSCYGCTAPASIQGDTQASNLLSAQFQRTMEFRPCQYAILLSALRLAARLMRLRLPAGESNGVKTKVLLWINSSSLQHQTESHWHRKANSKAHRVCYCGGCCWVAS